MPLLILLLALVAPRIVLVLVWLFTDLISSAYQGLLLPILGLVFLPLTTLVYAWAVHAAGGVQGGFWLVAMIVAVIVDIGGTGWRLRRRA